MKISKKTFITAIENIQKQYDQEIKFSEAVNAYFSQDVDNSLPRNYVVNSLVEILQQQFNDENANSWIEYYLWELDFGKKDLKVEINGEPYPLKTPNDLYNLLTYKL